MSLYHPKFKKEAKQLKPEVMAMVVHAFLEKVQRYSEEVIETKWKALQKKKGKDPETLQKLSDWTRYHRFNQIALEEIEDGTLDHWFQGILK
jgi:hypothetical protein